MSHWEGDLFTGFDFLTGFLPVMLWLVYVVLMFRLQDPSMRVMAAAVGFLILVLPLADVTFWVIALAHTGVLVNASFALAKTKGGKTHGR